MSAPEPQFLKRKENGDEYRLALRKRAGRAPTVVWLGGFRSDMLATKASALDDWAARSGHAFVRFDYTGHGESEGDFEKCCISTWLADSLAVIEAEAGEAPVLVGSSMGGWLALLANRALRAKGSPAAPGGLVLIAPAVDFTERLMWDVMPEAVRDEIMREGRYLQPSQYSPEPYAITRLLIEDGRNHLMLGSPIATGCPVHILQGMQDPDVPWQHAMELVEHLPGDETVITLVKDGDHRLSRPQDLDLLVSAVEGLVTQQVSGR